MQELMDQAKKDLRGKKFVLDRYGKPVVVGSSNAEKLPPFSTPLSLNIKNPGGAGLPSSTSNNNGNDGGDDDMSGAMGVGGGKKDGKKKQFVRVAGSRGVDESSFKPTLSLAVTLSGVENIPKLNPGVSVRSSTSMRSGSKIPDDPKKMSRKQYMSQSLSRRSGGLGENSSIDSMSRTLDAGASSMHASGAGHGTGMGTGMGQGAGMGAGTGADRSMYSIGGASKASKASKGSVVSMSMRSVEGMPDLDYMEGARRIHTGGADGPYDLSDEELGLGPSPTKGQPSPSRLPGRASEHNAANLNLLAGSPENGKPRDRDMPKNMRPVAERKHLPAPPLGHITGHGLSIEKFVEKTKLVNTEEDNWHQDWRT
jgi:hypothetical protein